MTRRSSCWNDAGSDARWQQSKWRAGSILISTPPRCSSTQQTPATIAVCPGVSSHFLPRWLHHTLLLLHVSCDTIHLSFEVCPCITYLPICSQLSLWRQLFQNCQLTLYIAKRELWCRLYPKASLGPLVWIEIKWYDDSTISGQSVLLSDTCAVCRIWNWTSDLRPHDHLSYSHPNNACSL